MSDWRIDFEEHSWDAASITAGEAIDICRIAEGGYECLLPHSSPGALVATVAVLLATRAGEELQGALARVQEIPIAALLACLKVAE